jgi:hypothetical protein
LLAVSVAQVEGSMKLGDESVCVLTQSFARMVDDMGSIQQTLMNLEPGESRDSALQRCNNAQEIIESSIVAFQFYDRLQQCLEHVSIGLKGLSAIIDTPHRLYNPDEWHKLQTDIRGRYTMESEKVMFDAILQGKSIDEALTLASHVEVADSNEVELF